jgi:uncharacterized protein
VLSPLKEVQLLPVAYEGCSRRKVELLVSASFFQQAQPLTFHVFGGELMQLKAKIQADIANAMRTGDVEKRNALRMLLAAVKQVEVDERRTLSDADVTAVLTRQVKQLRESISDAEKSGREQLAAQAEAEVTILEAYLPQMMEREEIRARAEQVIEQLGVSDPKAMGQVMGRLMPELKGQADGRVVTEVVRLLLQERT